VLVFGQLILGAVLRHTGAGLAIPDVPLAFGRVVPPILSFEIAIHFAHRVTGVLIGLLVAGLAILVGRHPGRSDLQGPARAALALVAVQILLGAASVITRLAVIPTTAHVVTGALLLATLLTLTLRSRQTGVWEGRAITVPAAQGSPA
jgi:cytochrome c oxidase assembly protein subunit 15